MSIRAWVVVERARRAGRILSGETVVGGEGVLVSDGISRGGVRDGIQQEQDVDLWRRNVVLHLSFNLQYISNIE